MTGLARMVSTATLPDEIDLLLVEDDPLEVELLLRPLGRLVPAERIGVARDGEEALDYLLGRGNFRHRIGAVLPRLVLLGLRLPRLDGVDVLRALRAGRGQQLRSEAGRVPGAGGDAADAGAVLAAAQQHAAGTGRGAAGGSRMTPFLSKSVLPSSFRL
jgi:CheY-like chemotaxis protein